MSKTKAELTADQAEQETKTERNKSVVAAEQKKTLVYIGPSIKNVVSTGTVYNNGLPAKVMQEIEKQPIIKSLVIPVDKLAAAQKELATQRSALAVIYGKVITK